MNSPVVYRFSKDEEQKEETRKEIKDAVRNIDNTLRIQELRGNKDAAFLRKHL